MKCAVHPEADATGFCRNCGKPMCPACVRPVRDVLYCEDCLASILGHPGTADPLGAAPVASASAGSAEVPSQVPYSAGSPSASASGAGANPVLAFFLGFLPGLGAFYNEQYGKGMIFLAVFLALFIAGVNGAMSGGAEAALWLCISALWIYMPIEALRTAQARRAGQPLSDPLDNFSRHRPIGPILLIGAGILLLLNNFEWFQWFRFWEYFWPLLLIAIGVLMFRNRMDRRP
jgi:TM2 domain-containing membrane protein YozV